MQISRFSLTGALFGILWAAGCADFFAETPTELQSKSILHDLSKIQVLPDPNVTIPQIYQREPDIVQLDGGAKLFYFTRHQNVKDIAHLVTMNFKECSVSQLSSTNQLVVQCKNEENAQEILAFLDRVDVPPIQVKVDCLISEIYADVTMDWETTILIENLFGESITLGGKVEAGVLLPAFPGASLRDVARSKLGLKVGFGRNLGIAGHEFRALVDLLVSRGYLKILMNPSLEVVNGKTAMIETSDHVPLPKEVFKGDIIYQTTVYEDVIDSLKITPHVYADGYIGLETEATIGSKSTPEGVKQIPIITKRMIKNSENRIRQGESLIIGGIRKTEERSVVRGVPFLKDIPILGILFSSKDYEKRAKEILFIITPTMSSGGIEQYEMVEKLREKHKPPQQQKSIQKSIMDPLGYGAETQELKEKAQEAEFQRFEAHLKKLEAQKAQAQAQAEQAKAKAETKAAQAEQAEAKAKAQSALAEAEKQAQAAKAEAAKAKAELEKARIPKTKPPTDSPDKSDK